MKNFLREYHSMKYKLNKNSRGEKKCEINNSIDEFNSRLDTVEERFCKLEESLVEKIEPDWTTGRKKKGKYRKSQRDMRHNEEV